MTTTRYAEVAERLRQAIGSAETGPAGALPTEAELCSRYGASRTTIRRALLQLRAEGLLHSRQGSGWSAAPVHRAPPEPRYRVRSAAARSAGDSAAASQQTVGHRRCRPPSHVAAALRSDRAPLLLVERVTRLRGVVIHRAEVWFNADCSAWLDPDEACAHAPARLLARHGQAFGRFDQYVEAVAANLRDQQLLRVTTGKPILQIVRTAYAQDGTPLFRSRHRHPGHNTEVEIWLPTSNEPGGLRVTVGRTR